jgi:acyl-coenzyme A synthetase/AMP-(fatty) acid ligase/SAM-dependent methyltransferase
MKEDLVQIFAWASGADSFELIPLEGGDRRVVLGLLIARGTRIAVPIVDGFPFFTESRPHCESNSKAWLRDLKRTLSDPEHRYEHFARTKARRGHRDIYAAFQPFNESTRALYPLLPILGDSLAPGEVILDTWNRTGFSGELLAGLFPDNEVVSIWQGDSDVLGYRGYRFWLGESQRRPNHTVVFHNPDEPLPFGSGRVGAVVGLDSIHRYRQSIFIPECLRVCKPDGVLVFPHVHLSNSEPDPFSERGGVQRHGREYHEYFQSVLQSDARAAFIMSEQDLFSRDGYTRVENDPGTPHYNGLVLVADRSVSGMPLVRDQPLPQGIADHYLVVNPVHDIDCATRRVRLSDGSDVEYLLHRHPLYRDHANSCPAGLLTDRECIILFLALQGMRVGGMAAFLGVGVDALRPEIERLQQTEMLQALPLSPAMARLQVFYRDRRCLPPHGETTLANLWRNAVTRHAGRLCAVVQQDQSRFSYGEAGPVVDQVMVALRSRGVERGDRVMVYAGHNIECLLLFWAVTGIGALFVPVDPEWPAGLCGRVVDECRPKLLFVDPPRSGFASQAMPGASVVLDDADGGFAPGRDMPVFSQWIDAPGAVADDSNRPGEADPAVILHTSGSTGVPKGVVLSHRALARSARLIADVYAWAANDLVYSIGGLHTVSGLRNLVIAPAVVAAACLVPASDSSAVGTLEVCERFGVSILGTVPAALALLARPQAKPSRLRFILSTATRLPAQLRTRIETGLGIPVYDYYGLTETCGACVLQFPDAPPVTEEGYLGRPYECIAQVVDEKGGVVTDGGIGELRVFSDRNMTGYWHDADASRRVLRDGWIHTGDLARIDDLGNVYLRGRKRDIIKLPNGDLVFPDEVEAVLARNPDVVEVAVCGVADDSGIERMAAFVHLRDGAAVDGWEMRLREQAVTALGRGRAPARFIPVAALPRGANGKIRRQILVAEFAADADNGTSRVPAS